MPQFHTSLTLPTTAVLRNRSSANFTVMLGSIARGICHTHTPNRGLQDTAKEQPERFLPGLLVGFGTECGSSSTRLFATKLQ